MSGNLESKFGKDFYALKVLISIFNNLKGTIKHFQQFVQKVLTILVYR